VLTPPLAAASRTEPPDASERRARAPRVLAAWPAARPCRARVLRWRATRVGARPPRGGLASRHEPRLQQPAAPSRQTPPSAAARAPRREFLPLGRRLALSRGRAALACDSSSGAPTPGGLASRHGPLSRQPTPSRPSAAAPAAAARLGPLPPGSASLRVMIIGQPEGQRQRAQRARALRLGQAQQPALFRREPLFAT